MSKPVSPSPALPIAPVVLRILIALNWVMAAGLAALLILMPYALPLFMRSGRWINSPIPYPDTYLLVLGLRGIAALGLLSTPLHYLILKRLLAMVETVRAGDPFVAANAERLQAIGWALLAIQMLSITIGAIANAISTPVHPLHLNAGFSISGWLAVLLTFLLARVFAAGTLMRDDLEGTV
jgi:hypothetical protein